jgi:hypothetical protein
MITCKKQEFSVKTISSSTPMIIQQSNKKKNKFKKINKNMDYLNNKLELLNYLDGELKDF